MPHAVSFHLGPSFVKVPIEGCPVYLRVKCVNMSLYAYYFDPSAKVLIIFYIF